MAREDLTVHAGSYLNFLLNDGTREYRETPGNISIKVWSRKEKDCCHFLLEFEEKVLHYESYDVTKR
ncbi:MAG TPA: hypothetical protein VHC48_21545 [Puia sp.]|nr:hypothetical protein [Puia sp.]